METMNSTGHASLHSLEPSSTTTHALKTLQNPSHQTSHDRGLEGRSILATRCSLDSNNHDPSGKEVVKNILIQDCEMYCKMADKSQGH